MALTTTERDDTAVVPQMNVTPLVDVVLVLLIIFMVITPLLTKTFWVHTPIQEQEEVAVQESDPTQPLVLGIGPDRTLLVNGSPVTYDELPDRLRRVFAARSDHVLFFDADDHAPYGFVVQVMDQAREGGAVTIAALTEHLSERTMPPG
jgi:biopolymer transport protein ExbD/biopolymer transport protein TolR